MNNIDKGLIAMRIAYNTNNQPVLENMLRDLVRYGCSADEIYENCSSSEMKLRVHALIADLGLKPVVIP